MSLIEKEVPGDGAYTDGLRTFVMIKHFHDKAAAQGLFGLNTKIKYFERSDGALIARDCLGEKVLSEFEFKSTEWSKE